MAEIHTIRGAGLDVLFDIHGEPATYTPLDSAAVATRVKIERNVDRYEVESGQVITAERRTLVRVRIEEITESKRGDTIVNDAGETFIVDEVEGDNGFVRTLVVRTGESS